VSGPGKKLLQLSGLSLLTYEQKNNDENYNNYYSPVPSGEPWATEVSLRCERPL
jgi:hypothetical protein